MAATSSSKATMRLAEMVASAKARTTPVVAAAVASAWQPCATGLTGIHPPVQAEKVAMALRARVALDLPWRMALVPLLGVTAVVAAVVAAILTFSVARVAPVASAAVAVAAVQAAAALWVTVRVAMEVSAEAEAALLLPKMSRAHCPVSLAVRQAPLATPVAGAVAQVSGGLFL